MKLKIICAAVMAASLSCHAHAGFNKLTHHSRANCIGFNETISWDATEPHWLCVRGRHISFQKHDDHIMQTDLWSFRRRVARYHPTEGYGGWAVLGQHWMKDTYESKPFLAAQEVVHNCSIYDGWWDWNGAALDNVNEQFDEKKECPSSNETKVGINIWPESRLKDFVPVIEKNLTTLSGVQYNESTLSDNTVNVLLERAKNGKAEAVQYDKVTDIGDTHLKSSPSKIKLSFKFTGVPNVKKEDVIGFAAGGGATEEKGWDGVIEFFTSPDMGACAFETMKIVKVILGEDTTIYTVNNKPSSNDIIGNHTTGFLYVINWYDPDRMFKLKCTKRKLDPNMIEKMTEMAKSIDRSMSDNSVKK